MKKTVLMIIVALSISLFSHSQWVKKANFPDMRIFATAFSIDNYGYVGGGILDKKDVRDFWRYDIEADIWEPIDSLPVPRKSADAVSFGINSKAYVCCTFGVSTDVWQYDPITGKWTQKADIPEHYSQAKFSRVAFSIGNYGYLFAGNDLYPGSPGNNFFQYNPESDTWTEKATCPVDKIIGMAGFSIKEKGYIGTGLQSYSIEQQEFWEYDPKLDQWSRIADFPGATRADAVAFSIGNYGYVGSGKIWEEQSLEPKPVSDFWRYDQETDTWEQIDSIGYKTSGAYAFTINGNGYVGGGGGIQMGEFWEYKPLINSINSYKVQDLTIYPNPATERIHWNTNLKNVSEIFITNIDGQVLQHHNFKQHKEINVSGLPNGIYFFHVKNDKYRLVEKIVIKRNP